MVTAILSFVLTFACSGTTVVAGSTEETIITMERQAMDGWLEGNPDRFLAIFDPSITYFHSTVEKKLDGVDAVRSLFESYRGRPLFDRYEISDPKVVAAGNTAVLTYLFTTHNGSLTRLWHATEVYVERPAGWRILHSHFSLVKP